MRENLPILSSAVLIPLLRSKPLNPHRGTAIRKGAEEGNLAHAFLPFPSANSRGGSRAFTCCLKAREGAGVFTASLPLSSRTGRQPNLPFRPLKASCFNKAKADEQIKYGWSCSSLLTSGSKNTLDMKTIRQVMLS